MHTSTVAFPAYDIYSTSELVEAFRAGPGRLRAVIDGLNEVELHVRARGPNTWSAHEIVIHTVDSEIQGTYRMRKAWAEPGASFPSYNQDAWAISLNYQDRDDAAARERALTLLEALRAFTLPLFERATADEWNRVGIHAEFGEITLHNLLELYADHTERHVAQILEIRRLLGKPINLPLLLTKRLL